MRKLFAIIATFVAATSCLHDNGLDVLQPFEVNIDAGVATKMVLDEGSIKWENGDKIAVVFTHPSKKTYVNNDYSTGFKGNTSKTAKFVGSIDGSVNTTTGYDDIGFAVYPHDAVTSEGQVKFNLPAVQTARENGSYAQGLNLSSSVLSLNDIREDGHASAFFRNALASLRFKLSPDVLELTITGTSPLTGIAPLKMYYNAGAENDTNNGRMVFDEDGAWSQPSNSMTLKPHGDAFASDVTYNLLMWPGSHNSLTLNITYKNLGVYEKVITFAKPYEFKANNYYNLKLTSTEGPIVTEITGKLDEVEGGIPSLDELEKMEGDISKIVSQIQSMTLLSEYLDNAAYANYAQFNSGLEKLDITLDYIVKPVAAAEALVNAFETDHSVASAVVSYVGANGLEVNGSKLSVKEMQLVEMENIGKILRVTMDASGISQDFYDGKKQATLAFQVSDGNTDVLSDFAKLVSKAGNAITGSYLKNIPAIPGARVVIPFQFAVADPNSTYSVVLNKGYSTGQATVTTNSDFKTGHLSVVIDAAKPIESQKVTLRLVAGSDVVLQEFSFVDSGSRIEFTDPGQVDYIGGDIVLEVKGQGIQHYMLSSSGAGVSQSGNIFTFAENTGAERTANVECQATIPGSSLNYYKSFTLTQRAVNTPLVRSYYTHAQKVVLNQASASGCSNYFNIVILGDGYKKKDLAVGGKFERSARSAMDSFFAIEPYATFKDRFNVYMVTYESVEEGTDIKSSSVNKNTYFNSYCQGGGNTAAYVDDPSKVTSAVRNVVGNSNDAAYYRTIAILLVNTDENAGSTGYPFRDYKSGFANGYASFAIAVLAANSTGTNGLVKHEAGGHAFGRLADEYYTKGNTASDANKTDLSNWHAKGWYWNVNPSNTQSYYKFNVTSYSSDELSFIEGAWGYEYGMYRPTQGGMMQGSTGVFNAPSRHAIYHRIITESQGENAYNINNFLTYDQKNR